MNKEHSKSKAMAAPTSLTAHIKGVAPVTGSLTSTSAPFFNKSRMQLYASAKRK